MSFRDLKPHEQIVVDRLEAQARKVNRSNDTTIRSSCPAHDGDDENLTVYLNADGIRFNCHSQGCTHEEIRNGLGLTQDQITPGRSGLRLVDYALAKKLLPANLIDFRVRETNNRGYPRVEFDYYDFDNKYIHSRTREAMTGKEGRVHHKKGNDQRLYGMWRRATFSDCIVIVEGESDCHTLWSHDISAVGVPGANVLKQILPDLEILFDLHPDLQPYVFQEPDGAGYNFVKDFENASFRHRIKVVKLQDFKDASELHCHDPKAFVESWNAALCAATTWMDNLSAFRGKSLGSLSPAVKEALRTKPSKVLKSELYPMIEDLLMVNGRLLRETSTPYMKADDNSVVAISDTDTDFVYALHDCGLNPREEIFKWVTAELRHKARREGEIVRLVRYSSIRDGKLYISSGTSHMVTVQFVDGEVVKRMQPNGEEGILFAGDSCYPYWVPGDPVNVEELTVFRPCLEATEEAPGYTPVRQQLLFQAWLVSRIANIEMPVLACLGAMESGKSKTIAAVAKLFMGERADVSQIPQKEEDFFANVVSSPVYSIDNFDDAPPPWFPNAFATAVTGGNVTKRKLYQNSKLATNPMTARYCVSSRNPRFAQRSDIADRLLPLFFGDLPKKIDKEQLYNPIALGRNGLFSYLAERAAFALLDPYRAKAHGSTSRFPLFEQVANSLVTEYGDEGEAIRQSRIAASVSVEDTITLASIIQCWFEQHPGARVLEGGSTLLTDRLKALGGRFEHFIPSSGRAFSTAVRENRAKLDAMGFVLTERVSDDTKIYKVVRAKDRD